MPRESKRCDVCKSRKLRCQINEKGCVNCARSGITCPGVSNKGRKWKPRFKGSPKTEKVNRPGPLIRQGIASIRAASPNSATTMRVQALSRFFDSYLPDKASCSGFSHLSFLTTLPYRNDTNPALKSAIEAVSVAQIGAEFNDPPLMRNASHLYRQALAQLTCMLSKTQADEDTLAASQLLAICEFSPTANNGGSGHLVHNAGQVKILQMIGPQVIAQSPFLFQQFLAVRNTAFTFGVLQRRSIAFAAPEWMYLTSTAALVDPWVSITDSFSEIPTLQETIDACGDQTSGPIIEQAISLLLHLEDKHAQWRRQYHPELSPRGPWIVAHTHLRYVKDITPPPVLNQVYRFSDFRVALLNILFWGLRWDFLRIRNEMLARSISLPPSPLAKVNVSDSQRECGLHMAKSAAFCCQSRFGSAGRIGSLIGLKYAAGAFQLEGMQEEAAWCAALSNHIRENSICQPPIWQPQRRIEDTAT